MSQYEFQATQLSNNNESDLNLLDMLIIFISVFVLIFLDFVFLQLTSKNALKHWVIFSYMAFSSAMLVPYFYAKISNKRFLSNIKIFNEHKKYDRNWIVGLMVGFLIVLICRFLPIWNSANFLSQLKLDRKIALLHVLFLPFTIFGFLYTVFGPISEELLARGILYNFLKKHMNVWMALFIQAVIFASWHLKFDKSLIYLTIIGFILWLLYEKTSFLITSIVCHMAINYFIAIFSVL